MNTLAPPGKPWRALITREGAVVASAFFERQDEAYRQCASWVDDLAQGPAAGDWVKLAGGAYLGPRGQYVRVIHTEEGT